MNEQRRLWTEVTAQLLVELIGIHQRAHVAFEHKLGRTNAFPLFQGKRRSRTVVYNAEYDSAGKLKRGVLFITNRASAQPARSEQWSIGRGWRQWSPTLEHLERLAGKVYDAVADEWNLDLAPLKMPIKLAAWVDELASEFGQRSQLDPGHPLLAKCLRRIFVRGGHDTVTGDAYELPHEGLGGHLVAYVLAACRNRVDQHWARIFDMPNSPVDLWPEAPPLWINLGPGADERSALGFPRPPHPAVDSPGGIQLAHDAGAEATVSFPSPTKADRLESWSESLHAIGQSSEIGAKIWTLTQPDILETTRQSIKTWDRSFSKWCQANLE